MFDALGRLVARHPGKFLLGWVATAVAIGLVAPSWVQRSHDDDLRDLPPHCPSVRAYELLKQAFPRDVFASKAVLVFERSDGPLSAADLALVDHVAGTVEEVAGSNPEAGLGTVSSHRDPLIGSRLRSPDGRCTLVMVAMNSPFLALRTGEAVRRIEDQVRPLVDEYRRRTASGPGLQLAITGPSGIGRDINDAVYRSLDHTTIATLVLVIIILILIYRSPLLALVPLVTIGGSVYVSLHLLAVLSLIPGFQIVNITRIFVIVVLFGAGTDYCLFLVSRYREESQHTGKSSDGVRIGLRQVGWALTASAGTVVCGLGMMGFAELAKVRYIGPAIALSLVVALLASLTLAPALLRLLGRAAFWPSSVPSPPLRGRGVGGEGVPGAKPQAALSGIWEGAARVIARRPGVVWLSCVALLLPLAILGYRTEYVYDFCAELPRDSQSRRGLEVIRRHFTAGEISPLTVLLQSDRAWTGADERALIARISAELSVLENVAEVRSLTQPLGTPASGTKPSLLTKIDLLQSFAESMAREHYLAQVGDTQVTRIDVVFHTEPFAAASVEAMHRVRAHVEQAVAGHGPTPPRVALYGITASTHDLAQVHNSDRIYVNALVLGGILTILLLVVRRPLLAVYLLATVLFSYYVTIGATELLALGWLDSALGQVDWKVPYFLFIILVAIGEDYNIFLITRVLEEAKRHGMRTGTCRALVQTGGTITSCGLIMAGTFATLMLCSLATLVQLGLALALGVLLDTFVVRPVLVPAFLLMINREDQGERERQPNRLAKVAAVRQAA